MRALLILAAVVVLLFIAGWVTFGIGDGDASINLETDKIKQDTAEIMEGGERVIEEVDGKIDVQIKE